MKNIHAIRTCFFTAIAAAALLLLVNNNATAANRQDTLITGEGGNVMLSTVAQAGGGAAVVLQHTFHGPATIQLSLRATDTLGHVTMLDIHTRGYGGQLLSDAVCTIPTGARVEVVSAAIQFDEYGQHYRLSMGDAGLSMTKDGQDYSYARRYVLHTTHLAVPGTPVNPLVPAAQSPDTALTIR